METYKIFTKDGELLVTVEWQDGPKAEFISAKAKKLGFRLKFDEEVTLFDPRYFLTDVLVPEDPLQLFLWLDAWVQEVHREQEVDLFLKTAGITWTDYIQSPEPGVVY